jgi:predicted HAD superfamily Cof-like phosphohydrolase
MSTQFKDFFNCLTLDGQQLIIDAFYHKPHKNTQPIQDWENFAIWLAEVPVLSQSILNGENTYISDRWVEHEERSPLALASELVGDFHRKMEGYFSLLRRSYRKREHFGLQMDLIAEEYCELEAAYENGDLIACADALTDSLYVLVGMFNRFGLGDRISILFDEVHSSNLTKIGAGQDENGKVMKGDNYKAPNIKRIIEL